MRLRILEINTVRNWFIPQVGFLMRKLEISDSVYPVFCTVERRMRGEEEEGKGGRGERRMRGGEEQGRGGRGVGY